MEAHRRDLAEVYRGMYKMIESARNRQQATQSINVPLYFLNEFAPKQATGNGQQATH